jgi:hypothetical protein
MSCPAGTDLVDSDYTCTVNLGGVCSSTCCVDTGLAGASFDVPVGFPSEMSEDQYKRMGAKLSEKLSIELKAPVRFKGQPPGRRLLLQQLHTLTFMANADAVELGVQMISTQQAGQLRSTVRMVAEAVGFGGDLSGVSVGEVVVRNRDGAEVVRSKPPREVPIGEIDLGKFVNLKPPAPKGPPAPYATSQGVYPEATKASKTDSTNATAFGSVAAVICVLLLAGAYYVRLRKQRFIDRQTARQRQYDDPAESFRGLDGCSVTGEGFDALFPSNENESLRHRYGTVQNPAASMNTRRLHQLAAAIVEVPSFDANGPIPENVVRGCTNYSGHFDTLTARGSACAGTRPTVQQRVQAYSAPETIL